MQRDCRPFPAERQAAPAHLRGLRYDLPYIDGKREVSNFDFVSEFPMVGDENIIYKAEKEQSLYQFNPDTFEYEKLSDGRGIDDIQIINGGTA